MSPSQFRWLSDLAAHGPKVRPRHGSYAMLFCNQKGWTEWVPKGGERITEEGRRIFMIELNRSDRCSCCGHII